MFFYAKIIEEKKMMDLKFNPDEVHLKPRKN